jgi:two-component system NtrC family sensor kinase
MSGDAASATHGDARAAVIAVDDVVANLVVLEALLADLDCELVRTTSGNDALRLVLKREFAVMLLDVHMPEMDGYEVARLIRQNPATRALPIVFVTATHNTETNILRGYGTGAVDFLFKPIDATILRSKVRVFLELYAGRRALQRAYTDLQHIQAQLIQSAKMSSLGELVAGIAHEINNPLGFATSHLGTAQRNLAQLEPELRAILPAASLERLDRANNRLSEMGIGLERIRDLVLKLRTFSRLDEGERKLVNVRECIDSVLTIFGHRLKGRIEVHVEVGEPESIDCYPALFNQALSNLLSNAIDAIPAQGHIAITAHGVEHDYVLSVADSGPGIPEALRTRVVEPFFTTKPVGEGTGLGLSITYSIVQKHGGALQIGDASGGGAVLTIRLPLQRAIGASP